MIVVVLLTHLLLSVIFPVGRVAVRIADPVFFTGIRMIIAGIILLGYQWAKSGLPVIKKELIAPLVLFIIFGIYLTNVPEFWALKFLPAAKASFIYSLSPFVSALLSYICFKERMTGRKILGMIIGMAGFLAMISYDAPGEISYCSIGFISWGEVAMIVAAISTAYGWIVVRPLMRSKSCSSLEVVGIGMLAGGIIATIQALIATPFSMLVGDYVIFVWCMLFAVVCSSVLGYVLYVYLLSFYTTTFLSFAGFVEPFFAALMSWIINGEVVTWRFFACAALVFVGLVLFYKEELKQGYIIK